MIFTIWEEGESMFVLHQTAKAVSGSTDPAITAALAIILAVQVALMIWVIIKTRE